jgi:hypothetical protein
VQVQQLARDDDEPDQDHRVAAEGRQPAEPDLERQGLGAAPRERELGLGSDARHDRQGDMGAVGGAAVLGLARQPGRVEQPPLLQDGGLGQVVEQQLHRLGHAASWHASGPGPRSGDVSRLSLAKPGRLSLAKPGRKPVKPS